MQIKQLNNSLTQEASNPSDLITLKKTLNLLGYYTPSLENGIDISHDPNLFDALRLFQKDFGLAQSGILSAGDQILTAINIQIAKSIASNEYYIWRTPIKTLSEHINHSRYDHEIRSWKEKPTPFDPPTCSCWIEAPTIEQIARKKKQKSHANLAWEEQVKQNIKRHEGDITYPYCDTAGLITIGVGININIKEKFYNLPWRTGSVNGIIASRHEIEMGYQNLRKNIEEHACSSGTFNIPACHQQSWTKLYLADIDRNKLFENILVIFKEGLVQKFANFHSFPPSAKCALTDMIYNMGETRFSREKFPNFFRAINQRDWLVAALHSSRKIPAHQKSTRNQETYDQLILASEIEEGTRTHLFG